MLLMNNDVADWLKKVELETGKYANDSKSEKLKINFKCHLFQCN